MPNETEEIQGSPQEETRGRSVEELRKLAFTDELTGLMNRRFLRNRLPTYINMAASSSSQVTLSMLDLDSFKQINDTYGHMAGDEFLKTFADHFKATLGHNAIPIRFAGDEFVAIFTAQDKKSAKATLDSLIQRLQDNPVELQGDKVTINVSIGVANYPVDATDHELLFRRADEALYYAKEAGKNRVITYPDEGKLVAAGNISTIFPVSRTVGFDDVLHELSMLTINRIVSEDMKPELPIVCGGRGSGKSRLLDELCKKATSMGRRVICLTGIPGNSKPYYALIKAFGEALRSDISIMRELASELSPEQTGALVDDIPELQEFSGGDIRQPGSSQMDTVTFQALNTLLFGILRNGRTLMAVDNAHHLDQVTLEFIDSFLAEFPESEIDLAFAINADSDSEREDNISFLLGNLSRLARFASVNTLKMPSLKASDIAAMLQEITGLHDLPIETLRILEERSGGNPLFIEELLQLIIERGIIDYDGTKWEINEFTSEDLPASLDEILKERAKALTDSEKDVLQKAAVIGESFDVRVLAEMCDRSEQEVLKDLEKARRAHIIYELKGRENEFAFHSNSTMSVFYSMIDEKSLKQAHREVANLELDINKGHEEEVYGKVARHYQKAGDWGDAAKIIATSKERYSQARIPEATRRMLQRKAFEADMAKESPLEKEDVARAVKVLRNVKVAAQALRLYPRENENVGKAIDKSYEGITSFFDLTEVLTFSVTHDSILINGQSPGPENTDERLATEFRQMISPYQLQGIVFTKGLSKDELERFLAIFKLKPEQVVDIWEDILEERELFHVRPDRKIYVALGQRKVELGDGKVSVDTAKYDTSSDSEVAQKALQSIRELIDEFHNESKELLDTLSEKRNASEEIDKLIKLLEELTGYIPKEIKEQMTREQEPSAEAEAVVEKALEEEDKGEISVKEVVEETERATGKPANMLKIDEWIDDLKSSDKITKARAAQNLLQQGKLALNPCAQAITIEHNERTRRLLGSIIKRIGKSGELVFASMINHPPDDEGLIRLLSVADIFGESRIVGDAIGTAIRSSNKDVQKTTIRALSKFPAEAKCSAAITALSASNLETNALGLYIIGLFRLRRLLPRLLDIANVDNVLDPKKLPLAITAIRSLGYFDNEQSIECLRTLVLSNQAKQISERIRIESIRSLAKIKSPISTEILQEISQSNQEPYASEARTALEKRDKNK